MGKVTLHTDQYTRMEKYRPWQKLTCHRIHTKRKPSSCNRISRPHLNCSTDSGTFINCGQGWGFLIKTFVGSDMDDDLLPHIPDLGDYVRMCLTEKVRCTCKPMSQQQTTPPLMTGKMGRTRSYLPTGVTRTILGWVGLITQSGPYHHLNEYLYYLLQKEMRKANGASTFTHTTTGLRLLCKLPLQTSPGWPKGIRTNPATYQVTTPEHPKDPSNIGLCITKIATILKEAFATLD